MYKSFLLALVCSVLVACNGSIYDPRYNCNGYPNSESAACDGDHSDDDHSDDDHSDDDYIDDDHPDDNIAVRTGPKSLLRDMDSWTATLLDRQPVDVDITTDWPNSYKVELTAFGRNVDFRDWDLAWYDGSTYYKYLGNDEYIYLVSNDGSWYEAHNRIQGYRHLVRYYAYLEYGQANSEEYVYDVYGDKTSIYNMPTYGRVTYRGEADGMTMFVGDSDRISYSSDVTLTADFGSSTIHGSASPAEYEDGSYGHYGVNIDEASITGNTFATTLSVDTSTCSDCPTITSSQVDGTFFGPNAAEVGGSYSFTSESRYGDEYVDIGNFAAKK